MSLVIRKKNGLLVPKTPKLILPKNHLDDISLSEKIIEEEIQRILKEKIGVSTKTGVRRLDFIPIYSRNFGEKEIGKIHLKNRYTFREEIIEVAEIESSGVMLIEFFDFIITAGAIEIQDASKALEIM